MAVSTETKALEKPPGPHGHFALGVLLPFRRDPLGTLRAAHEEFGDVVYFRGALNGVFLANPRDIAYVMEDAFENYPHPKWFDGMFAVSADGLVSHEGADWRRLRRLQEPILAEERVKRFAPIVVEESARLVERWRSAPGIVDASTDMRDLSHAIIGRSIFGPDWSANAAVLSPQADVFLDHTGRIVALVNRYDNLCNPHLLARALTPQYAAPEQLTGAPITTESVDTIGLGSGQDSDLLGALARESGGLYQAL